MRDSLSESYCPFCDKAIIKQQQFYEDDFVIALCTHQPSFPGHCLILPKRHVKRFDELTDEEAVHINHLVKQIDKAASQIFRTSAYLLLQKNGGEVGQSVSHLHIYYIPREKGDYSLFSFLWKFLTAPLHKPLKGKELDRYVAKFREYEFEPKADY